MKQAAGTDQPREPSLGHFSHVLGKVTEAELTIGKYVCHIAVIVSNEPSPSLQKELLD